MQGIFKALFIDIFIFINIVNLQSTIEDSLIEDNLMIPEDNYIEDFFQDYIDFLLNKIENYIF